MASSMDEYIKEKQAYLKNHTFEWDTDKVVSEYTIRKFSEIVDEFPEVKSCFVTIDGWEDRLDQTFAHYDGNIEMDSLNINDSPEHGVYGYIVTGSARFNKGLINMNLGGCELIVLGDLRAPLIIATGANIYIKGVTYAEKAILHRYNDGTFSSNFTKTPLFVNFDGHMDPGLAYSIDYFINDDEFTDAFRDVCAEGVLICQECIDEQVELGGYGNVDSFVKHIDYERWLTEREPCEECDDVSGVWDISDEHWIARLSNGLPIVRVSQ